MSRPRALAPVVLAAVLALAARGAAAQAVLEATVTDAATGTPVVGAVAEAGRVRAAADEAGRVRLRLPFLPTRVVVRAVGFRPDTLQLAAYDAGADGTVNRAVTLARADVEIPEVEVVGDRVAAGRSLIEKVLARKAVLAARLGAYAAEAYTRHRVYRADANEGLVRLTEAASFVYWQRGRGAVEEVGARRRIPAGGPFTYADLAPVPDVYFEDGLRLDGTSAPGPLSPRAFDDYTFLVGEPVRRGGLAMIEVVFSPRRAGLWSGRLRVVDSLFVVAEAEFRPPTGPDGTTTFDATYRVAFAPLLDSLWVPVRFERRGFLTAGGTLSKLPPVRFEQVTLVDRHRPGDAGPPDLWAYGDRYYSPRGVYAGTELYERHRAVLPFTAEERRAEGALRGRTLPSLLAPYGFRFALPGLNLRLDLPVEGDDDPAR